MPVHLLDVNLLVALAWPRHAHHERAINWFARSEPDGFATCPMTQAGFIRVSSNPTVIPKAKSPKRAIELLNDMTARDSHVFWPDDLMVNNSEFIPLQRVRGHKQITDAYLLAGRASRGTVCHV